MSIGEPPCFTEDCFYFSFSISVLSLCTRGFIDRQLVVHLSLHYHPILNAWVDIFGQVECCIF